MESNSQSVNKKIKRMKYEHLVELQEENKIFIDYEKRNVTQSNALIRAAHHLTLQEKRIVYMAISQINPTIFNNSNVYKVRAKDYSKIFHVDMKNVYTILEDASTKLFHRFWQNHSKNGELIESCRWVYKVRYLKHKGEIELYFTEDVMKHLQGLFKEFTSYKLKKVANLKSRYSWKLYEILNSVSKNKENISGWLRISTEDLKNELEIPKSYKMGMIKKQIIIPSIKELNDKLNLNIQIEEIKTGRTIKKFMFTFFTNKEPQE